MAPSEAKGLTFAQLEAVFKHGLEREKEEWRRTRWLAAVLVNISGKSTKKVVKETDLLKFEEEKNESSLRALLRSYGERRN
jgi:Cys-tRNA synthase (O-phospho-L-seryl-tRNA:Cys-tRNA synthase)